LTVFRRSAEENRGSENGVGRATVLSLILVGAMFMLQTWVAADLARGMRFASPDTAFYEVAERAGARGCGWSPSWRPSSHRRSRMRGRSGRRVAHPVCDGPDGKLPPSWPRYIPASKTPYVSTLAVAVVSLLVGLLFRSIG